MSDSPVLNEKEAASDPFVQFDRWYKSHLKSGTKIPESVSVATARTDGKVSARTVLLKEYNEKGFVFFTNYLSKKGKQLDSNPNVALLFYWQESDRQVRIEGVAEKVTEEESVSYFHSRPRESQISAWVSEQSTIVPDREYLEKRVAFFREKFFGKEVDKPNHWGGFRVIPDWFEFWQDGDFRLHDRITYTRKNDIWIINRLAP
jgi:pyridoxamine 5'-phosphate oxidase